MPASPTPTRDRLTHSSSMLSSQCLYVSTMYDIFFLFHLQMQFKLSLALFGRTYTRFLSTIVILSLRATTTYYVGLNHKLRGVKQVEDEQNGEEWRLGKATLGIRLRADQVCESYMFSGKRKALQIFLLATNLALEKWDPQLSLFISSMCISLLAQGVYIRHTFSAILSLGELDALIGGICLSQISSLCLSYKCSILKMNWAIILEGPLR